MIGEVLGWFSLSDVFWTFSWNCFRKMPSALYAGMMSRDTYADIKTIGVLSTTLCHDAKPDAKIKCAREIENFMFDLFGHFLKFSCGFSRWGLWFYFVIFSRNQISLWKIVSSSTGLEKWESFKNTISSDFQWLLSLG